jgi:hypothetical protein
VSHDSACAELRDGGSVFCAFESLACEFCFASTSGCWVDSSVVEAASEAARDCDAAASFACHRGADASPPRVAVSACRVVECQVDALMHLDAVGERRPGWPWGAVGAVLAARLARRVRHRVTAAVRSCAHLADSRA